MSKKDLQRFHGVTLKIAVSLIFLARGWLTWRWDSPMRGLIWQEDWWSRFLPWFGTDWATFARTSDTWISPALSGVGILLISLAAVPWLAGLKKLAWTRWLLLLGLLILILDGFSRWSGMDWQFGIALEYLLQISSPLALFLWFGHRKNAVFWLLLIATMATFTGHGLYAAGYYATPLEFRMMTTEILPLSETQALTFLKIVGWLDFIVVILLFIPRAQRAALFYMVAWGGLTTMARVVAYFQPDLPAYGLDPWLAEALVRTPHWLIPVWILRKIREKAPLE